jgi:type I restriction enzyme M protein
MFSYQEISPIIWWASADELMRFLKPQEYGDVILPFVVVLRVDCLIKPYKDEVVSLYGVLQ